MTMRQWAMHIFSHVIDFNTMETNSWLIGQYNKL